MIVLAEEFDPKQSLFLQPTLELKASFDHVMRAISVTSGHGKSDGADYPDGQIDKALGHVYRSYFDAADWLSMNYREKIKEALEPFPVESILAALPDYYTALKPSLLMAIEKTAQFRCEKDIGKDFEDLFSRYEALLDELKNHHSRIQTACESMSDHHGRRKRSQRKNNILKVVLVLLGAVVAKALSFFGRTP